MPHHKHQTQGWHSQLAREASFVAHELDSGDANLALGRFQEDVQALRGRPSSQREFVALVDRFERKGMGVDLDIREFARNGATFANIRAVQPAPWIDFLSGQRPELASLNLGDIYLGRGRSHSYYEQKNGIPFFEFCTTYGIAGGIQPPRGDRSMKSALDWNQSTALPGWLANEKGSCRQTGGHNNRVAIDRRGMWLAPDAAAAFERAERLAAMNGVKIDLSSAGRTHKEQSQLYRELAGRSPVAKPGESFHEKGTAIDVKNYQQAKPYLLAAGFIHGDGMGPIPGDPWHFRYLS